MGAILSSAGLDLLSHLPSIHFFRVKIPAATATMM